MGRYALLILFSMSLLASCSRDEETAASSAFADGGGILKYIPADTPYVFVSLEPIPDDVKAMFEPQRQAAIAFSETYTKELLQQATRDAPDEVDAEFDKWGELLIELSGPDLLETVGLDEVGQAAIYGVGLTPVVRLPLSDASRFDDTVKRVETAAGAEMLAATLGSAEYRYVNLDPIRLVLFRAADQLVMTVVPKTATDDDLSALLGLRLPDENIAESGRLARAAKDFDLRPFAAGLVDMQQVADRLFDEGGLLDMLADMGSADPEMAVARTPECRAELSAALTTVERLAFGIRKIDTDGISAAAVADLRDDLADAVQGLASPVPGLGEPTQALFAAGFSFDAVVARRFVMQRLDAIAKTPFACDPLATINAQASQAQATLARQALPPAAADFNGVYIALDDLDFAQLQTGDLAGGKLAAILATANPESLTALAALAIPGFAELGLKPDGEEVAVPAGAMNPLALDLRVAMSGDRIALAAGEESSQRLGALMSLESSGIDLLTSVDLSLGAYFSFATTLMTAGDAGLQLSDEAIAARNGLFESLAERYDRGRFRVSVSAQGLEFTSDATFKD
jgi:hypothetical protein